MKVTYMRYLWVLIMLLSYVHGAHASTIATDSRIKTFVYNENEVFHVTVNYGYQSNIEFSKQEEIETISIGNSYSWKITPVERRLFIKALEGAARTNMTVITNRRTYQFEIESKDPDDIVDENLVYVVRFFYPGRSLDTAKPVATTQQFIPDISLEEKKFNYNYSLTGPDAIAPLKVFDDGRSTFLQFPNNNSSVPHIFTILPDGSEVRSSYSRKGEYIVINRISAKIILKLNRQVVTVYNDKLDKFSSQ